VNGEKHVFVASRLELKNPRRDPVVQPHVIGFGGVKVGQNCFRGERSEIRRDSHDKNTLSYMRSYSCKYTVDIIHKPLIAYSQC
jgi:hypothetical protein